MDHFWCPLVLLIPPVQPREGPVLCLFLIPASQHLTQHRALSAQGSLLPQLPTVTCRSWGESSVAHTGRFLQT